MISLDAVTRKLSTKGNLTQLRKTGNVPAVVYGGKDNNLNVALSKKEVNNLLFKENFSSNVINLNIDGKSYQVLPKEIAFDTVTDEPIHIDFLRIVAGTNIILEIPVKFINNDKCPGLKRGGVLNIVRRKVELKCPAENIPEGLTVDLNNLDIGASIKISSIDLPEKVRPTITDRDFVIATVAAPTVVKEPEKPAETTEEDAEGSEASAEGSGEGGDDTKKAAEGEKNKELDKKEDQKSSAEKK